MNNLEKTLRIGEVVILDNDNFCLINESDDFRQVECSFRNENTNTWANGFKIQFSGTLVHSSKTFIISINNSFSLKPFFLGSIFKFLPKFFIG